MKRPEDRRYAVVYAEGRRNADTLEELAIAANEAYADYLAGKATDIRYVARDRIGDRKLFNFEYQRLLTLCGEWYMGRD